MTTVEVDARVDALSPLREALLARARADAEAVLRDADADAAAVLAQAQSQADALLAQARDQGELDAAEVLGRESSRTERAAREVVLAARRAAYDRLRHEAQEAVCALRHHPDYPRARAALDARAGAALGPGAVVHEVDQGGVVAVSGSRSASYTLDGLADAVVDRLGTDVEGLWAP